MMELEEMKVLWDEMSHKIEKQKILTDKIIINMTQERYNNKLRSISIPETIGALICFATVVLILIYFEKLDTWYMMVFGMLSAAVCFILPVLSITSIYRMKNINISKNNYRQILIEFSKRRRQFLLVQRLGIYLCFLLLFVSLPVAGKIMSNKDIFIGSTAWLWYVAAGVIFLFFFARWGYRCYANITASAENILKEMEE